MKRFLLMTALLLGIMGMAFTQDSYTLANFDTDWHAFAKEFRYVCIMVTDECYYTPGAYGWDSDADECSYYCYYSGRDSAAISFFSDHKTDIYGLVEVLVEDGLLAPDSETLYILPNEYEKAIGHWRMAMRSVE